MNNNRTENILPPTPNYILVDSALWGFDMHKIKQKNKCFRSLYRGEMGEALNRAAPYLFTVEAGSEFEKWIKQQDPVEKRVLWLHSSATIGELRNHLRRFLRMKTAKGTYLFRFYDPHVISCVLPHLTEEQRKDFFGQINYIIIEDRKIEERRTYSLTENNELAIKQEDLCGQ